MLIILFKKDTFIDSDYFIEWKLNKKCNFQCKYCFSSTKEKTDEHKRCGKYSIDHITECFNKFNTHCKIHLAGGEPFLYPDFVNLCKMLTTNHLIVTNTNLSTNNVKPSIHIEEREKRSLYHKFIDEVLYLKNRKFKIQVEYVLYPSLFYRIESDLFKLKNFGITIFTRKLTQIIRTTTEIVLECIVSIIMNYTTFFSKNIFLW